MELISSKACPEVRLPLSPTTERMFVVYQMHVRESSKFFERNRALSPWLHLGHQAPAPLPLPSPVYALTDSRPYKAPNFSRTYAIHGLGEIGCPVTRSTSSLGVNFRPYWYTFSCSHRSSGPNSPRPICASRSVMSARIFSMNCAPMILPSV